MRGCQREPPAGRLLQRRQSASHPPALAHHTSADNDPMLAAFKPQIMIAIEATNDYVAQLQHHCFGI